MLNLETIVEDFALGLIEADKTCEGRYGAGIGPLPETDVRRLVYATLQELEPSRYATRPNWYDDRSEVPYPDDGKKQCDLCLGEPGAWQWAIEFKCWRRMMAKRGQNQKLREDKSPYKKILSPYPEDGSAVTDAARLAASAFPCRKAIIIYGYAYEEWPMEPMMEAFEQLASTRCNLGPAHQVRFANLRHGVQKFGAVYAWEVLG